jgi:quercetin dioxygenase-like cupin family protein
MRTIHLAVAFLAGAAVATAARSADPPVLGSATVTWEEIQAKPAREGRLRQIFRDPTATLDELEIHVSTLKPGLSSHAPHKHPNEEVIIVHQGTLEVYQNGETRKAPQGSILFMASNQMHSVKNVGEAEAVYHVINWFSPGMKKAAAVNP